MRIKGSISSQQLERSTARVWKGVFGERLTSKTGSVRIEAVYDPVLVLNSTRLRRVSEFEVVDLVPYRVSLCIGYFIRGERTDIINELLVIFEFPIPHWLHLDVGKLEHDSEVSNGVSLGPSIEHVSEDTAPDVATAACAVSERHLELEVEDIPQCRGADEFGYR